MNIDNPETSPDSEEELDDPYIHTVSTEEFVETVEKASQEEPDKHWLPSETSDQYVDHQ